MWERRQMQPKGSTYELLDAAHGLDAAMAPRECTSPSSSRGENVLVCYSARPQLGKSWLYTAAAVRRAVPVVAENRLSVEVTVVEGRTPLIATSSA